jgi:hypothetical protein
MPKGHKLGYRERERLHQQAQRFLIHALAGMTERNLAFALYNTGRAVLAIAELDEDQAALDQVEKWLHAQRKASTRSGTPAEVRGADGDAPRPKSKAARAARGKGSQAQG